jgi:BirA family biotin operon repressor/biotin-[acetyl-CoA-carboxylase] ligase
MAVAETMHRFLSGMVDAAIQIKWPNDIYVGDSKIGGILIENHLSGEHIKDCIIGIGLNVNQTVFVSDAPNPISMRMIDDREWNREEVLQGLISELVWQIQHFRIDIIRKKYRRHLYRREGFYPYRDAEGEFEAEMLEVENDGHLVLLDTEGRQRRYAFKEVAYVI